MRLVIDCRQVNKLKRNPGKNVVLPVCQKAGQRMGIQPVLDGIAFDLKTQVCSLGVLVDSFLNLDA